ncbi:hypothetical protein [Capnocytophaga felis]|uniref:Uncharacterized protein n=1 Tax=Capnocytophaga felis TaxID=2267611 RepID=A0A5M4BC73_9FLAO|nr:hypothetical protein [Capnocytophaga felis]GET47164.1 hypothetical protein RCZ01_24660 [Capnocytophaga felis]GET49722.1 hypothetical protein RCZ02_25530 [Capnocytophaga felis]
MDILKELLTNVLAIFAGIVILVVALLAGVLTYKFWDKYYYSMISRRERYRTSDWDLGIGKITKILAALIVIVGFILYMGYMLIKEYILS